MLEDMTFGSFYRGPATTVARPRSRSLFTIVTVGVTFGLSAIYDDKLIFASAVPFPSAKNGKAYDNGTGGGKEGSKVGNLFSEQNRVALGGNQASPRADTSGKEGNLLDIGDDGLVGLRGKAHIDGRQGANHGGNNFEVKNRGGNANRFNEAINAAQVDDKSTPAKSGFEEDATSDDGGGNIHPDAYGVMEAGLVMGDQKPFILSDGIKHLQRVSRRLRGSSKGTSLLSKSAGVLSEITESARSYLHSMQFIQKLFHDGNTEGAMSAIKSIVGDPSGLTMTENAKIEGSVDRPAVATSDKSITDLNSLDIDSIPNNELASFIQPGLFDSVVEQTQDFLSILEEIDFKNTPKEEGPFDFDSISTSQEGPEQDLGWNKGSFRPQSFSGHSNPMNFLHHYQKAAFESPHSKNHPLFTKNEAVTARHERRLTALGAKCHDDCEGETYECPCERLFGCVQSMTEFDLAVLIAGDFLDRNPSSDNFGKFTIEASEMNLFRDGSILREILKKLKSDAQPRINPNHNPRDPHSKEKDYPREKCDDVMSALFTACDSNHGTCSNPNSESQAVSVEQVCDAVNTPTKFLFEEMADSFDGFLDETHDDSRLYTQCEPLSFSSCKDFVVAFDEFYSLRDEGTYAQPNPMRSNSTVSLHDKNMTDIFFETSFPVSYQFNRDPDTGVRTRTFPNSLEGPRGKFRIVNVASGWDLVVTKLSSGPCVLSTRSFDPVLEREELGRGWYYNEHRQLVTADSCPYRSGPTGDVTESGRWAISFSGECDGSELSMVQAVDDIDSLDGPTLQKQQWRFSRNGQIINDYCTSNHENKKNMVIKESEELQSHSGIVITHDLTQPFIGHIFKMGEEGDGEDEEVFQMAFLDSPYNWEIVTNFPGTVEHDIPVPRKNGLRDYHTCLSSRNDTQNAKWAMNTCDESMKLLTGSQMSVGTLKAINSKLRGRPKSDRANNLPGSCCFDTPHDTQGTFGSHYDPAMGTCRNKGPWHTSLSEEACQNAGGRWARTSCLTLKRCIEDRPSRFVLTSPAGGSCQSHSRKLSTDFVYTALTSSTGSTVQRDSCLGFCRGLPGYIEQEGIMIDTHAKRCVCLYDNGMGPGSSGLLTDATPNPPKFAIFGPDGEIVLGLRPRSSCSSLEIQLEVQRPTQSLHQSFFVSYEGNIVSAKCPDRVLTMIGERLVATPPDYDGAGLSVTSSETVEYEEGQLTGFADHFARISETACSNCCQGVDACSNQNNANIGDDSCVGRRACNDVKDATIGDGSCKGVTKACAKAQGYVGDGSCVGVNTVTYSMGDPVCFMAKARIGDGSCDGIGSCLSGDVNDPNPDTYSISHNLRIIGSGSCLGRFACRCLRSQYDCGGQIGDGSCVGPNACDSASAQRRHIMPNHDDTRIGKGSCIGSYACKGVTGEIGNYACTHDRACLDFNGVMPDYCPSVADLEAGNCNSQRWVYDDAKAIRSFRNDVKISAVKNLSPRLQSFYFALRVPGSGVTMGVRGQACADGIKVELQSPMAGHMPGQYFSIDEDGRIFSMQCPGFSIAIDNCDSDNIELKGCGDGTCLDKWRVQDDAIQSMDCPENGKFLGFRARTNSFGSNILGQAPSKPAAFANDTESTNSTFESTSPNPRRQPGKGDTICLLESTQKWRQNFLTLDNIIGPYHLVDASGDVIGDTGGACANQMHLEVQSFNQSSPHQLFYRGYRGSIFSARCPRLVITMEGECGTPSVSIKLHMHQMKAKSMKWVQKDSLLKSAKCPGKAISRIDKNVMLKPLCNPRNSGCSQQWTLENIRMSTDAREGHWMQQWDIKFLDDTSPQGYDLAKFKQILRVTHGQAKTCYDTQNDQFSGGFEEFAKSIEIIDPGDEAQCRKARDELISDPDYPFDTDVCLRFDKYMCNGLHFDQADVFVESLGQPPQFEPVEYEPLEYAEVEVEEETFDGYEFSEDSDLDANQIMPLPPKADFLDATLEGSSKLPISSGFTSKDDLGRLQDAWLGLSSGYRAGEHFMMFVSDEMRQTCNNIPETIPVGPVSIPNPAKIICNIASTIARHIVFFGYLAVSIAEQTMFNLFEKSTEGPDGEMYAGNAARMTYRNMKQLDQYVKGAFEAVDKRMDFQHETMQQNLQLRHEEMATLIGEDIVEMQNGLNADIVNSRNALGQSIVSSQNALGQAVVDARNANSDQHNGMLTYLYDTLCLIYVKVNGSCTDFIGPLGEGQTSIPKLLEWPEDQPTLMEKLGQMEMSHLDVQDTMNDIKDALAAGVGYENEQKRGNFGGILGPDAGPLKNALTKVESIEDQLKNMGNEVADMQDKVGSMDEKLEDMGSKVDDLMTMMSKLMAVMG